MTKPAVNLRKILIAHRDEGSPIGDLARDVQDDPTFPKGKQTLTKYLDYLDSQKACSDAKNALKKIFTLAVTQNTVKLL